MYGKIKSKRVLEIHQCPLESSTSRPFQQITVHLYPESAGCRVLTLDG
jgi:hypothetical protein